MARYLRIYVIQALLASLIALPAFVVLTSCGLSQWPFDNYYVGFIWAMVGLWVVGFVVEVAADMQLRSFYNSEQLTRPCRADCGDIRVTQIILASWSNGGQLVCSACLRVLSCGGESHFWAGRRCSGRVY